MPNSTRLEKDDYVILKADKKNLLVKVRKVSSDANRAIVINKLSANKDTAEYVDFQSTDVLANLGANPTYGTAYGLKIEPLIQMSAVGPYSVYYYRYVTDKEKARIEKHLRNIYLYQKKNNYLFDKDCEITIRNNVGRMLGYYKHASKKDRVDELCLRPKDFNNKELPYLIHHEVAHGIWFTRLPTEWQSRWIKAYSRNVSLFSIKSEQIVQMREELAEYGKLSTLNKQLDDEGKETLKECLRYIKRAHSILPRHINMLLDSGDSLKDYWPKTPIDLQRKQVVVSEYAMTAPDEFFADAYAFYVTQDKKLPKSVNKLMQKTLNAVKAGSTAKELEDHPVEE